MAGSRHIRLVFSEISILSPALPNLSMVPVSGTRQYQGVGTWHFVHWPETCGLISEERHAEFGTVSLLSKFLGAAHSDAGGPVFGRARARRARYGPADLRAARARPGRNLRLATADGAKGNPLALGTLSQAPNLPRSP